MELIKEWNESNAYTFMDGVETEEEIDRLIEMCGCDHELIRKVLSEKYEEDEYFVLVDYIDDGNNGYFHIRIWRK